MDVKKLLETVTELSHEFGTPEYVKGGGGNTSVKQGGTLWVKPSGTTLAGLTPGAFVEMDRVKLGRLYELSVPADSKAREALVKDVMAQAVNPGQTARPSVEAPLHDVLQGTYVVHTHPALVNGLTCGRDGQAACQRLFPDALWVPYVDPGFTLCIDVRRRVEEYAAKYGCQPALLLLENHGVFVSGNTPEEVRATYRRVMDSLRKAYAAAGVAVELEVERGTGDETRAVLKGLPDGEAAAIAYGGRFQAAPGPVSPDHIVYAKSFPYEGELTAAGVAAFRQKRGYTPLVYLTRQGVYAIGPTQKKADLALELAVDGALVRHLAGAFGGIRYLDDRAREFIENWEVESYRQKQV
jgi:rhamnose utilization protein RhaD (predicted bifunctional aldolase and dehydrogenase)